MQTLLSGAILALVGLAQAQVPAYGQCMIISSFLFELMLASFSLAI